MQPTILIVDDDTHVIKALCRELRHAPYRLLTAFSADEGLRLLEQHHCAVVIADYQMPGNSGLEFLAEVKRLQPEVIRIMLTGKGHLSLYEQAFFAIDIFDLLLKPWNTAKLLATLQRAVHHYDLMIGCDCSTASEETAP